MRNLTCPMVAFVGAAIAATVISAQTTFPASEWRECAPESQGVDRVRLQAAADFLAANSGRDRNRELVLVRHGWLIARGDHIDHVHGIWSCTKSFTSTVLGLLVADGRCSPETKAAEILPELQPSYPKVTLRHFATMTSGYRAAGDDAAGGHGQSKTPFAVGDPLFAPGAQFLYWDSAMNKFAEALTVLAGEPLQDLFKRRVAEPIGLDPAQWRWGDRGTEKGLMINGGAGNGGGHLFISARELARFGLLMLNEGRWDGRLVVEPAWIREATRPHVGAYGMNWWSNGVAQSAQRKWPGAPPSMFAALGFNNNHLFIIPEWDMVVVRLGLDQRDVKMSDETWSEFFARLTPAIGQRDGKQPSPRPHGTALILGAPPAAAP